MKQISKLLNGATKSANGGNLCGMRDEWVAEKKPQVLMGRACEWQERLLSQYAERAPPRVCIGFQ